MRRAPIILTATAFGTAGVLAFHAHAPAITTARVTPSATAAPSATATPAPSGTATPQSPSGASGTATGDAVGTQYGNAQVKVTVKDGRITAIDALQLQGNDSRSVMISSSAEPILQQEALAAQSAQIDTVSGATYTSESYKQSLQSALDKLGFTTPSGAPAP